MMKEQNYIQNAPRLSLYNLAPSVTTVEPGQLFQLNDDSEWEYADGTRRAYPTLNSRYPGAGIGPQGELLEGRDDVTMIGKIVCLRGNFEIGVTNYDKTKTYTVGQAVKASTSGEGILEPFVTGDDPTLIRGYVTVAPSAEDEYLTYEG